MKIVMKFGGSSVADGDRLRKAGTIIRKFHRDGHSLVVVTSAMYSVTDSLADIAKKASKGEKKAVHEFIESMQHKHRRAAESSIMDEQVLGRTMEAVNQRIDELKNILLGVAHIGELTPRSKDYVLGYGEKMSAPLLQGVVEDLGMKSKC
jgi:aspartate kinase